MGWPDMVVKRCRRAAERGASISAEDFAGFSLLMRAAFRTAPGASQYISRRWPVHISILGSSISRGKAPAGILMSLGPNAGRLVGIQERNGISVEETR